MTSQATVQRVWANLITSQPSWLAGDHHTFLLASVLTHLGIKCMCMRTTAQVSDSKNPHKRPHGLSVFAMVVDGALYTPEGPTTWDILKMDAEKKHNTPPNRRIIHPQIVWGEPSSEDNTIFGSSLFDQLLDQVQHELAHLRAAHQKDFLNAHLPRNILEHSKRKM